MNEEIPIMLAEERLRKELPDGIRLVRTLWGHKDYVCRIAWSPDGRTLATASADLAIRLWNSEDGKSVNALEGHKDYVWSVVFHPREPILATASHDGTIKIWDARTGSPVRTIEAGAHRHAWKIWCVAFHPTLNILATGGDDATVRIWDFSSGKLIKTLHGHEASVNTLEFNKGGNLLATGSLDYTIKLWDVGTWQLAHHLVGHRSSVLSLAFDPSGDLLATGNQDETIKVWDSRNGKLLRTLEGHTESLNCVAFSPRGSLLASKASDGTVRIWQAETGECRATILHSRSRNWAGGVAFHPHRPLLATVGAAFVDSELGDRAVRIWELDFSKLLGHVLAPTVTYTSAKIVIIGDSGVGKTGLGWRLAHAQFKEHPSTHGQQFWLLPQLSSERRDGTRYEAVLWDLAGQPDYRLIHALFLDDADLAFLLFDATRDGDPLGGIEFWLKQLNAKGDRGSGDGLPVSALPPVCPIVLVAARSDCGHPRITHEELRAFCKTRGIVTYLPTSAKTGEGTQELIECMQRLICWDEKPATVTTGTFKRIKDFVLSLKENERRRGIILTLSELRQQLQDSGTSADQPPTGAWNPSLEAPPEGKPQAWKFTDAEILTAVGHLATHGYVTRLKTSHAETRILLAPELLNNLAASFVLNARRHEKGLGSLEEGKLLSGAYDFPELEKLSQTDRTVMLDSAAALFLRHNICFRETNPLLGSTYLVFPELINLRPPADPDAKTIEDGPAYTVAGAVENLYASLVVLMGYTQTFTRTSQWRNQARYEVGNGQVCGFRLDARRPGELDFVLYFGTDTDSPVRMLFQSLFESFLGHRGITMLRFDKVTCSNGHEINRTVVREQMSFGAAYVFCGRCGKRTPLPQSSQCVQLNREQADAVEVNRRVAGRRSQFEQVLFRLKTYVAERQLPPPESFISYAWGNREHERWVEKSLASDLQKAGVDVVLDRWENARIGSSIPRFVERVSRTERVIVVGTPLYKKKYENGESMRGFVVAAEGDLIGRRLIGTEKQKETVLPVLLEGTDESAFPNLLHGRVYADFRDQDRYFDTALDLLLSLYEINPRDAVSIDLRQLLEQHQN